MVSLERIGFYYKKKRELFVDLSLVLEPGKIYGLLGKNASGKSTLFKLVSGALFAKQGSISIDGIQAHIRDPEILQEIFYLQEDFKVPMLSILNYVKIYSPFYPRFDMDIFESAMESFEVDQSESLTNLSFGQTKKVMIAFALATDCKYILLDEPTNGLDIPSKAQLRRLISTRIKEDQCVVISTHQVQDIASIIERVIILDRGRIAMDKDLIEISDKMYFTRGAKASMEGEMIYSEMVTGGYVHIMRNELGLESDVELESLFNAITKHPEIISKYL